MWQGALERLVNRSLLGARAPAASERTGRAAALTLVWGHGPLELGWGAPVRHAPEGFTAPCKQHRAVDDLLWLLTTDRRPHRGQQPPAKPRPSPILRPAAATCPPCSALAPET